MTVGPPTAIQGKHRGIAPYLGAYTLTMLGDRIAEVALPLAILAVTDSPAAAGIVAASMQFPALVVALSLGHWSDRNPRRSMLVWADIVRAAGFAAFALLAANSVGGLLPFLLIGTVVGCGNVLFGVATQAALPQIVHGAGGLGRANALLEAGDGVMTIVGPSLAGAMVARLGAALGLVINAITFAVSGLLLRLLLPPLDPLALTMHVPAATTSSRATSLLRRHVAEPLTLVIRSRFQTTIQLAMMALSAHGVSLVLAVLILGRDDLGLSIGQIGLVLSAAGVGGLAVALLGARFSSQFDTSGMVALSLLLSAVAATALALSGSFWWALVANGALDAFITAGFIATSTIRQARTPNDVLGRVASVSSIANNLARVVGAAGVGLLAGAFGARMALAVDAALLGTIGLLVVVQGRTRGFAAGGVST